MTGIGAVSLVCLIALAVLLRGDVRAEDAVEAEMVGEARI
jgi:hypothetical protein